MATYREIKAYVKAKYAFVPDNCWIAHAKDALSQSRDGKVADVDISSATRHCTLEKRGAIFSAIASLEGEG